MSNAFEDQVEDQTGEEYLSWVKKHMQEEREATPLTHPSAKFTGLLRTGNLDYFHRIIYKVNRFRTQLISNNEYYVLEGMPILSSEIVDAMEFFLFELFEKQIQNNLTLPLYSISYYEGYGGSIDLTLKLPRYHILINISSKHVIYSILHRINNSIVKKGSNTLESTSDIDFIENLVSDISYFDKS